MMNSDEIQRANVNASIAREAYNQADKRLVDVLDAKKTFEQKALTLLSVFVTTAAALFGAGAYLAPNSSALAAALLLCGVLVSLGAMFLVFAAADADYGSPGSEPNMWLQHGTVDGPDDLLGKMLAHVARTHQKSIEVSIASNRAKASMIRLALYYGVGAPPISMLFGLSIAAVFGPN